MALGLIDFEGGQIYFEGPWKGWALKTETFLGPSNGNKRHINNRFINSYFVSACRDLYMHFPISILKSNKALLLSCKNLSSGPNMRYLD
jgi:hypothetical protein